jgi:hypothetical protein
VTGGLFCADASPGGTSVVAEGAGAADVFPSGLAAATLSLASSEIFWSGMIGMIAKICFFCSSGDFPVL